MSVPASHLESDNPLLDATGLPRFASLRPAQVAPALDAVLAAARATLERLVASVAPDWAAVFGPLEALDDRLTRAWAPVAHLNAVVNSEPWRAAYHAGLPRVADWSTELAQDERLHSVMRGLAARADALGLDATQRKVLDDWLRDFKLAGVDLPPAAKSRFKAVVQELASLEARFEDQLLDATGAWHEHLPDITQLAGLPDDTRERARERALARGESGWTLSLEQPDYHAVVTHAEDRELRQRMWTAQATRASELGPHAGRFDNGPVMRDILRLRAELAQLVGFPDFAAYSLTTKMAAEPRVVSEFLHDLVARVRPAAQRELAALQDFARDELGLDALAPWDHAFAAERLRTARFAISQQELRPYFPAARVMDGLFALLGEVYGLRLAPLTGIEVWHPAVTVHSVHDREGRLRGRLFVDPYARAHKQSGAWMDACLDRRRTADGVQTPVAHLVCNFPTPTADTPSLLTHEDVLTLCHEMGHCLHHLLTTVEVVDAAGINGVPWDAVELPSQMHELFAWDARVLTRLSGHHVDGTPLPRVLIERLIAARDFHAALALLRQLEFGLFDMALHGGTTPPDPQAALAAVRAEVAVVQRPDWERFAHGFSHVFAGGYAAGYYGYLWAEVLASDAFAAFEERGVLDAAVGARFMREVLETGGSREPLQSFIAFRGRPPALDAFLRHNGLMGSEG